METDPQPSLLELTHRRMVPLYSFEQAADTLYFIMGFAEGESLEHRLRPGRVGS